MGDSSGEIGELSSLKLNVFEEYLVHDFTVIYYFYATWKIVAALSPEITSGSHS